MAPAFLLPIWESGRRNKDLHKGKYGKAPAGGLTFLSPNKKVSKEVGLGETLTVKSFVASPVRLPTYLDFKPLSPKAPSRPLSVVGYKLFF